jgi:hypothetical protein
VRIVNPFYTPQLVHPTLVKRRKNISIVGKFVHDKDLRIFGFGVVYHTTDKCCEVKENAQLQPNQVDTDNNPQQNPRTFGFLESNEFIGCCKHVNSI